MKNILNAYEKLTNNYNPDKFLPIRIDGEVSNKSEFVAYKIKTVLFDHKLA